MNKRACSVKQTEKINDHQAAKFSIHDYLKNFAASARSGYIVGLFWWLCNVRYKFNGNKNRTA